MMSVFLCSAASLLLFVAVVFEVCFDPGGYFLLRLVQVVGLLLASSVQLFS